MRCWHGYRVVRFKQVLFWVVLSADLVVGFKLLLRIGASTVCVSQGLTFHKSK